MNKDRKNYHCWIVNLTKYDISLSDIRCLIKAKTTEDILSRHHYLTPEQVQASIDKGCIKKMLDKKMILIRQSEPKKELPRTLDISKASYPNKPRSIVEVEEKQYKELDFDNTFLSDEEFAEKTAESAEIDHKSIIDEE